jgi:CO/xanthine dehydrogenase FAD-binding subunit
MLTFNRYLRASSLEEAYAEAQKKNSVILGGGMWLRLGKRRIGTVIDLIGGQTLQRRVVHPSSRKGGDEGGGNALKKNRFHKFS